MAVTGLESMKGDGMGFFGSSNRLWVEATMAAGNAGDGTQAQVSDGRLHTRPLPDTESRTITTGKYTVGNTATTIASATADCDSIVIQNQTSSPIAVCFSDSTPGSDDFQIAAGASWVPPFKYSGIIKAKTLDTGISGNVVVIRSTLA